MQDLAVDGASLIPDNHVSVLTEQYQTLQRLASLAAIYLVLSRFKLRCQH